MKRIPQKIIDKASIRQYKNKNSMKVYFVETGSIIEMLWLLKMEMGRMVQKIPPKKKFSITYITEVPRTFPPIFSY